MKERNNRRMRMDYPTFNRFDLVEINDNKGTKVGFIINEAQTKYDFPNGVSLWNVKLINKDGSFTNKVIHYSYLRSV